MTRRTLLGRLVALVGLSAVAKREPATDDWRIAVTDKPISNYAQSERHYFACDPIDGQGAAAVLHVKADVIDQAVREYITKDGGARYRVRRGAPIACLLLLLLCPAMPTSAQIKLDGCVNEESTSWVELKFTARDGVTPADPAALTYKLNDRETGYELIAATTVVPGPTFACDAPAVGCMAIKMPHPDALIVGRCPLPTPTACVVNADCGVGKTCAKPKNNQTHLLTAKWTYPNGSPTDQGHEDFLVCVRNLEQGPLP